jgi:hypothetical protein
MEDFEFIISRLGNLTTSQIFFVKRAAEDILRNKNIIRGGNSTVSSYAETLCCSALDLTLEARSNSGHDAICRKGRRYQIKARKLSNPRGSRQLGAIRRLDSKPFDNLIGILFDEDHNVIRAADIPIDVVRERARFQEHTNSSIFMLHDDVWKDPRVKDVTDMVRGAAAKLENPDS